jgi:hypothetical protein
MEYEITPRKCNTFDPSRRDVTEPGSVAASTTNGNRKISACGSTRPRFLKKRIKTTPHQISAENLVQNA